MPRVNKFLTRRGKTFGALTLLIFTPILARSSWVALGHSPSAASPLRIALAASWEVAMVCLIYWSLRWQKRDFSSIGLFKPIGRDFLHGVILFVTAYGANTLIYYPLQLVHRIIWGTWFQPFHRTEWLFGSRITVWPWILLFTNCVFEELAVRGWLMTEIEGLTGSLYLAAISSWLLQTAYHVYQGIGTALTVSATFLVFTIYFAKRRRLFPLILAHFLMDLLALSYYVLRLGIRN
jgi:membrane protease YdiL (CAAX protease family)